jgi:hypothetical protein
MSLYRSIRKAAAAGLNRMIEARERQAQQYVRAYLPDAAFRESRHGSYDLGPTAKGGGEPSIL